MEYNQQKIQFEGKDSKNPFAFHYYDPEKVVAGRKMKDHLKFAMSYWHTINAAGTDMFGGDTMDKSFGEPYGIERYKKKADFAFDLMQKLGIEYYCFHDVDVAPEGETLAESVKNLDETRPGGPVVQNPPANAGDARDLGSIPDSGRSPGKGKGNALQYSCLENPMDRGAWRATVHRVTQRQTLLKRLSTHTCS